MFSLVLSSKSPNKNNQINLDAQNSECDTYVEHMMYLRNLKLDRPFFVIAEDEFQEGSIKIKREELRTHYANYINNKQIVQCEEKQSGECEENKKE